MLGLLLLVGCVSPSDRTVDVGQTYQMHITLTNSGSVDANVDVHVTGAEGIGSWAGCAPTCGRRVEGDVRIVTFLVKAGTSDSYTIGYNAENPGTYQVCEQVFLRCVAALEWPRAAPSPRRCDPQV